MIRIWYSLANAGDGSGYPVWFTTEKLADWHQEKPELEEWGKPCTGHLDVEGENLSCPEAMDAVSFYLDLFFEAYDDKDRENVTAFEKEFFPNGVPKFKVVIDNESEYRIEVGGTTFHKMYAHPGDTSEVGLARVQSGLDNNNWRGWDYGNDG